MMYHIDDEYMPIMPYRQGNGPPLPPRLPILPETARDPHAKTRTLRAVNQAPSLQGRHAETTIPLHPHHGSFRHLIRKLRYPRPSRRPLTCTTMFITRTVLYYTFTFPYSSFPHSSSRFPYQNTSPQPPLRSWLMYRPTPPHVSR